MQYLDANNLYGYPVTQKLPVGGFKWVKNVSKIDEEYIKNDDENGDIGSFLKVDIEYPKELHIYIVIYHFYQRKWKLMYRASLYVC